MKLPDKQDDIKLRRELQLLKGSNGDYVLSTITDLYALIDFIVANREAAVAEARIDILQNVVAGENEVVYYEYDDGSRFEVALLIADERLNLAHQKGDTDE